MGGGDLVSSSLYPFMIHLLLLLLCCCCCYYYYYYYVVVVIIIIIVFHCLVEYEEELASFDDAKS